MAKVTRPYRLTWHISGVWSRITNTYTTLERARQAAKSPYYGNVTGYRIELREGRKRSVVEQETK